MILQLSPEQETRVAEALRSGHYDSPDQVIDRALDVLHEQDEWLTANCGAIDAKILRGIARILLVTSASSPPPPPSTTPASPSKNT